MVSEMKATPRAILKVSQIFFTSLPDLTGINPTYNLSELPHECRINQKKGEKFEKKAKIFG